MAALTSLVNCKNGGTTFIQCDGQKELLVTMRDRTLRNAASQLNSTFAQRALQESLASLYQQREFANGSQNPLPPVPLNVETFNVSEAPLSRKDQQRKCVSKETPSCQMMTDKLMRVGATAADKVDMLKREMVREQSNCESTKTNYEAQMAQLESLQKDAQTELAQGTEMQNQNEEQSRLKDQQTRELRQDYQKMMSQCGNNLHSIRTEMCSVAKIRAELYKMAGQNPFIQDCEVSAWSPEECSVSCGGGEQRLTRSIVTLPTRDGATCPPLQMARRCNEQPCPVDCVFAEWDRWSSCSARCGGGVKQRSRLIMQQPMYGGEPCGEASDSQGCNIQACDKPCTLSEWSEWSSCSKMCNTGLMTRRKYVLAEPVGNGHCDHKEEPTRVQRKACNPTPCHAHVGRTTLQCASKLDLIIMLDGSGSLGARGWQFMQDAGKQLVTSFEGGPLGQRVALMVVSGPKNWRDYLRCTKGPGPGESMPDLQNDCGIYWVSHFTEDTTSISQRLQAMSWPGGSTLLSAALMSAMGELRMGRKNVDSTVLVVSDARPMSPLLTTEAVRKLHKKKTRVMWVPVTRYATLRDIRRWASLPIHENVIHIGGFKYENRSQDLNTMIADICPQVK